MIGCNLKGFVLLCLSAMLLLRVQGFSVSARFPTRISHDQLSAPLRHRTQHLRAHSNRPTEITSNVDWLELLHDHDDDRLTLVFFGAPFCKSCHRFEQDWKRKVVPTAGPNLQLATADITKNRALFKELGIEGLPSVHFYQRGRRLTGYCCPPAHFSRVLESLEHYLNASPDELEFEAEMEAKRLSLQSGEVMARRRTKVMV